MMLILVFALLSGVTVIYADSKSLVGREVQADAVVTLNGQEVGSAIIIDGVSYAPVRVIAEASGLNAGYKKGEVMLSSVEEIDNNINEVVNNTDVDSLTKEKKRLEIRVNTLGMFINDLTFSISQYLDAIENVDDSVVENYQTMLVDAKTKKQDYEVELQEVKRRIAEIDELLK